jgi:hypothetical protein
MELDLPRPALPLVVVTQVLLGVLFLGGIVVIATLPGFADNFARAFPEYASLREPLLALTIALVLVGLIALAMVALLVHRISRGNILTRSSLLWVDVIATTAVCAGALIITGFATISGGQSGSPALAVVQVTVLLTLLTLACITLVLRSLLRSAIQLRTELDEVV